MFEIKKWSKYNNFQKGLIGALTGYFGSNIISFILNLNNIGIQPLQYSLLIYSGLQVFIYMALLIPAFILINKKNDIKTKVGVGLIIIAILFKFGLYFNII